MYLLEWIEVDSARWHLHFPSQRELGGLVYGGMQISSNSNIGKCSHCCTRQSIEIFVIMILDRTNEDSQNVAIDSLSL